MINRNYRDALNFLSKLNASRFLNIFKVVSSYYVSKLNGRPVQWGFPISISIEPTTSCNLRCPECPSGLRSFTRPTGMLEKELYEQIINEVSEFSTYLLFYFQGEPFLHKDFLNMVQYANSKNMYTATSTNAHYLTDENARKTVESGLDRLIISIDGVTQEVYEQYRVGGDLEKVLQGAKNIVRWKRKLKSNTPHVIFQFLVVKPNEHQMQEVQQLADEIGVDEVGFKTAQIYNYRSGSPLIPENDSFSRYKKQSDGNYIIKNQHKNHCWKLWHSCVITFDGMVIPCCFDKDAWYRMGTVADMPLKQIWRNEKYKKFRSDILKSRSTIEMCTNCTEGTKVWGA